MKNRFIFYYVVPLIALAGLPGCGGMAGAAGQALAGSAATGMVTSGSNKARFSRLNCEQLAAEIAGAKRGMINPLTIPSTQAYIKDAQSVAASKGCAPAA